MVKVQDLKNGEAIRLVSGCGNSTMHVIRDERKLYVRKDNTMRELSADTTDETNLWVYNQFAKDQGEPANTLDILKDIHENSHDWYTLLLCAIIHDKFFKEEEVWCKLSIFKRPVMKRNLLYIVRNNFKNEHYGHSILGVFSSLWKAYQAGHKKWIEVNIDHPEHHMELKVVQLDMSDYLGCSAYSLDFEQCYSESDIMKMQNEIETWATWKHFDQVEKEAEWLWEQHMLDKADDYLSNG